MKRFPFLPGLLGLALLATLPCGAPAHTPQAPEPAHGTHGTHGMVLVASGGRFFGSHMPMFHPPHDRQVVVELRPADPAMARALHDALAAQPVLWTLAPEPFDLNRLAPDAPGRLGPFHGTVHLGHFERGGRAVYRDVLWHPVSTAVYRPLHATGGPSPPAYHLIATSATTAVAFRQVAGRGDFDQVALVYGCAEAGSIASAASPDAPHPSATAAAAALETALRAADCPHARVTSLYFETDDLR